MICIETNSCPSGQKSMPWPNDHSERAGYRLVLEQAFMPAVQAIDAALGGLAVLYDKNGMEASGYAAATADLFNEPVYLVEYYDTDPDPPARWVDGVLHIRTPDHGMPDARAAKRQKWYRRGGGGRPSHPNPWAWGASLSVPRPRRGV